MDTRPLRPVPDKSDHDLPPAKGDPDMQPPLTPEELAALEGLKPYGGETDGEFGEQHYYPVDAKSDASDKPPINPAELEESIEHHPSGGETP